MGGGYKEDKVRQCRGHVWSKAGVYITSFLQESTILNHRPQKELTGAIATL